MADIDEEKIRWFLRTAKAASKYPLKQEVSVEAVLTHLNLIRGGKLTNATILLFGKNPHHFFIQAEIVAK
ncbi:MAG: hypothetical protein QME49_06855 [bacterium]|nr:hypothetical protein [bacterium]